MKEGQKRIIAQTELPCPGIGSKEQTADEDSHTSSTIRNNTNSNDTNSNADSYAYNGNSDSNNPPEVNHKQCINVDILITFVQSIGTLLQAKNTKEELIKNLYKLVENLVAKIKNPHSFESINPETNTI